MASTSDFARGFLHAAPATPPGVDYAYDAERVVVVARRPLTAEAIARGLLVLLPLDRAECLAIMRDVVAQIEALR